MPRSVGIWSVLGHWACWSRSVIPPWNEFRLESSETPCLPCLCSVLARVALLFFLSSFFFYCFAIVLLFWRCCRFWTVFAILQLFMPVFSVFFEGCFGFCGVLTPVPFINFALHRDGGGGDSGFRFCFVPWWQFLDLFMNKEHLAHPLFFDVFWSTAFFLFRSVSNASSRRSRMPCIVSVSCLVCFFCRRCPHFLSCKKFSTLTHVIKVDSQ